MPDKSDLIDRINRFLKQEKEVYGNFNPELIDPGTDKDVTPAADEKKQSPEPATPTSEPEANISEEPATEINAEAALPYCKNLEELKALCAETPTLKTDLEGTNLVFGVGNPNADLMLIGEAPGKNEDKQGEPFVGRAGKLLNKILQAINFEREDVYIANILKHRPPDNRDPLPEERQRSLPFLYRQIELIDPKIILCLGRISAQTLLDTNKPMKQLRGEFHPFMDNRELMVTFHPAALLRNPGWKRDTWEDVQKLRARYDEITGS